MKWLGLALLISAALVATLAVRHSQPQPKLPTVAGESISGSNMIENFVTPTSSLTPTLTANPTPIPTPTATWTVKDTSISYESDHAKVDTKVSTSTGSSTGEEHTNISVTVNGETRTIEN